MSTSSKILNSGEVWSWPETQKFIKKLGIDCTKQGTTSIIIELNTDSVIIKHEFIPKITRKNK